MQQLNILHVEDDRIDADLIRETLVCQGIIANVLYVETEDEFRASLQNRGVDLILADYALPAFDGLTALRIAREQRPELPFIFISGTIDDAAAVESLKSGATDYILKQDLQRLGSSVRRALSGEEEHRRRIDADQALRESEERHRLFFERSPLPMWVYELETLRFLALNGGAIDHDSHSPEEFLGLTIKSNRPREEIRHHRRERLHHPDAEFSQGSSRYRTLGDRSL
jgi:DNA-binding response OmpR family regulator